MIRVLSDETINQIAAGEVIERPLSIVKELLENSIDAGASSVSIEIKDGGSSLIRITDNGGGIEKEEVPSAFLRHATSKIKDAGDLESIHTLGFRGEALASIAAVAKVELITKRPGALLATHYLIEGGVEKDYSEIGAPDGTTMLVRELFYNVPARRKFLKSAPTEAARIQEIIEKEALAHPEVAFRYIQDGKQKLQTLGNGSLLDSIYAVFGREVASQLLSVKGSYLHSELTGLPRITVRGFIGKPATNRSNRNFEIYFVNSRFVKDSLLTKAIEDGYRAFLMQHKFPFTVLRIDIAPDLVDVNVHPQKLEVRFADGISVYNSVVDAINQALHDTELIVNTDLENLGKEDPEQAENTEKPAHLEPFEEKRREELGQQGSYSLQEAIPKAAMPKEDIVYSGNASELSLSKENSERKESEFYSTSSYGGYETRSLLREPGSGFSLKDFSDSLKKSVDREFSVSKEIGLGNVASGNIENTGNTENALQTGAQRNIDSPSVTEQQVNPSKLLEAQTDLTSSAANGAFGLLEDNSALDEAESLGNGSTEENKSIELTKAPSSAIAQKNSRELTVEGDLQLKGEQSSLFEERFLSEKARLQHRIIGQLFETYWLIEYGDKLYIMDQHAAHEKVNFERMMKRLREKKPLSQYLNPPILLSVGTEEALLLEKYQDYFTNLGFEIRDLGGRDFSVSAVPTDLPELGKKELLLEILGELSEDTGLSTAESIYSKIASMSCKAAVKGNNRLSLMEADALISELLTLDNPYACPHGRPTLISMSKYELEKKFKRVV